MRCPHLSPPAAVPCCGQTRCRLYYRGSDSAGQCLHPPQGWGIWPASHVVGSSHLYVEHFPPSPGGMSQPQQGPGTRWSPAAPGESQSPARPRWRVWAGPLGGKPTGLSGSVLKTACPSLGGGREVIQTAPALNIWALCHCSTEHHRLILRTPDLLCAAL